MNHTKNINKFVVYILILFVVVFIVSKLNSKKLINKNCFQNKYSVIDESSLPDFFDYPAEYVFFDLDKLLPINFDNFPGDKYDRKQVEYIYKKEPNFAEHYIIASIPCGTGVQCYVIVDYLSGKLYYENNIQSVAKIDYRIDSKMIIVNPLDKVRESFGNDIDKIPDYIETEYYKWENNKLILIQKRKMTSMIIGE